MKIGDVINRRDMPQILYRIIGVKKDMWEVELVSSSLGHSIKRGLIVKGDERWEQFKG